MPRREIHTDDIKIEQKRPIIGKPKEHEGEIVIGQQELDKNYADELKFMEEPVTIRLEPSAEKNAATAFPVWVNGKGAEVFQNGKWDEIGYLPVGRVLIVKRKVVEIIARAKVDTVHTKVEDEDGERPKNVINRYTSAVHSFSIIEDRNPMGVPWLTELRRRNM